MPLELIFNIFCPAFLCLVFLLTEVYPNDKSADRMLIVNVCIGAFQFICVVIMFLVERVNSMKTEWWIMCCPEFTYASGIAGCFVIPLVSVIFNAV